jgi:hypothetical protein
MQVSLAVHNYVDVYKRVPPAWNTDSLYSDQTQNQGMSAGPNVIGPLPFIILPFIEQDPLYKISMNGPQFDYRYQNGQLSTATAATIIPLFLCPADPSNNDNTTSYGYASSNYLANLWVFDPRGTGNIIQSMPDGSSNTIMFAEAFKKCPFVAATSPREIAWANHPQHGAGGANSTPVFGWTDYTRGTIFLPGYPRAGTGTLPNYHDDSLKIVPSDVGFQVPASSGTQECNPNIAQGNHSWCLAVALGDGSVRGISSTVTTGTWVRACIPNDGLPLGPDWIE